MFSQSQWLSYWCTKLSLVRWTPRNHTQHFVVFPDTTLWSFTGSMRHQRWQCEKEREGGQKGPREGGASYQETGMGVEAPVPVLLVSSDVATGTCTHWRMSWRQMGHFSSCRAQDSQNPLQHHTVQGTDYNPWTLSSSVAGSIITNQG